MDEDAEPRLAPPRSPLSESELSRSVNNATSHAVPPVHYAHRAAADRLHSESDHQHHDDRLHSESKDTDEPSCGDAADTPARRSSTLGRSPSHSHTHSHFGLTDRDGEAQGRSSRSPSNCEDDATMTFSAPAKRIMSKKSAYRKLSHASEDD